MYSDLSTYSRCTNDSTCDFPPYFYQLHDEPWPNLQNRSVCLRSWSAFVVYLPHFSVFLAYFPSFGPRQSEGQYFLKITMTYLNLFLLQEKALLEFSRAFNTCQFSMWLWWRESVHPDRAKSEVVANELFGCYFLRSVIENRMES